MNKKWMALMVSGCLLLTSCALLPEEEAFKTAPLINDYQKEEFTLALCTRGDMRLAQSVACVYVPVRSEGLRFQTGGIAYDEIYVELGDAVEQGQLLVQLDVSDLQAKQEAAQSDMTRLTIRLEHVEQNRQMALARQRLVGQGMSAFELAQRIDAINENYDAQKRALTDARDIVALRLADCEEKIAQRQLRAPMAGTVTYVRKINPGDRSVVDDKIVTVADSTQSVFRAETEHWARFHPGDEVSIKANKTDYTAVVTSAEELGIKEAEKVAGKKAYVYFILTQPAFDLEDNVRGTLELELDTRRDVLRVPSGAVSQINGRTVVYYQDDDGMKAYKNVTAGLTAEGMTEIIDGLDEGDYVIAG